MTTPPDLRIVPGLPPGKLRVVVTYLEMTSQPATPKQRPPVEKLALLRAEHPTVSFYRYLYNTVGEPWLWSERRRMDDAALAAVIHDRRVEIMVLYVGGVPAGFAELNLKQYAEAAKDLEKAVELQRRSKQEDPNTESALGQAYVLGEKYEQALPLLTAATNRAGAQPDALMIYYRGISEYKTGKIAEAEKSFNNVVKLNPKDSLSLFYLAQIALSKNDLDGAISNLNRATVNDARLTGAWTLLTSAYLRRAATSTDPAKAEADYLSAVRSGEGLIKLRTDAEAVTLFGQALIGSKQYARAAGALERATTADDATGVTFYLLGVAHSRAANFPKAIAALEMAAKKTPDDVNVYRELGYAFEVSKQYAKALAAYQKGAALAPADPDFKESIERVKPFAK